MKRQGELFSVDEKIDRALKDRDGVEERMLLRTLRAAPKGGLVNGMSKAALKRYAPAKLPRVTIDD